MRFNFIELSKECAKGLLLVLNAFCILVAICNFGAAVVDSRILQQYGDDQAIGTFAGDMTVIAVCVLLASVAILGCVGVLRENVKILYLYVGFILFLVILELLVGIFVGIERCGLHLKVQDWLREDFFKNVTGEELIQHQKDWDQIQIDYECCGLNGPGDYRAMQKEISLSCCPPAYRARTPQAQKQLYDHCIENERYHRSGCEEEILDYLRAGADLLLGVAFITLWLEAGALVMAMWVAKHLKNSVKIYKDTVKY